MADAGSLIAANRIAVVQDSAALLSDRQAVDKTPNAEITTIFLDVNNSNRFISQLRESKISKQHFKIIDGLCRLVGIAVETV